jgi:hypothetical protein
MLKHIWISYLGAISLKVKFLSSKTRFMISQSKMVKLKSTENYFFSR